MFQPPSSMPSIHLVWALHMHVYLEKFGVSSYVYLMPRSKKRTRHVVTKKPWWWKKWLSDQSSTTSSIGYPSWSRGVGQSWIHAVNPTLSLDMCEELLYEELPKNMSRFHLWVYSGMTHPILLYHSYPLDLSSNDNDSEIRNWEMFGSKARCWPAITGIINPILSLISSTSYQ